jgi:hydrogenase maturation protein HypF
VGVLAQMIERGVGAPLGSSTGRLFDAVAAALGICFDAIAYEGQAAIELETLARGSGPRPGYAFAVSALDGRLILDPRPLWPALLDDLGAGIDAGVIAARFHAGLADGLCRLAAEAAAGQGIDTVALSGGVFQNRTLFEAVSAGLREAGLLVLSHRQVPTNDGGIALGQAVMAAAAATRTA